MQQITGIVAEFNPFHSGHAALVRCAKAQGADAVVAVISGNFVQRGEPAVTDKRVRAKAALLCGVDLVLELPLVYAMAPAQRFARGAVELFSASGVVDTLIFGSECGDIARLKRVAAALDDTSLQPLIREQLDRGVTFARARQTALESWLGADAACLERPNNTLGVEYIRAAKAIGWQPDVQTMQRCGVAHDSGCPAGEYASGVWLRQNAGDLALMTGYVPPAAMAVYAEALRQGRYPADPAALHTAILTHLRRLGPDDLADLPDLSEGIENRLYAAIRQATTLDELETQLKTKRYTMARMRRLILSAFFGLTREDAHTPVPYLRVLGCTRAGREVLSGMKHSHLPVSHSLARLREHGGKCERFAALEELATDLYGLALPSPLPCGTEYTAKPVFL